MAEDQKTLAAMFFVTLLGMLCFSSVATVSANDIGAPPGVLLEAESNLPKSTVQVVGSAGASGGKAVTSDKEWEPMFEVATPKEGDGLEIHVRHKGGPLQLKAVVGGQQKELQWIWDQPNDWKWSSFGKFTREQLGSSLLIIRGGKMEQNPMIDCVVIGAPGPAPAPGAGAAAATPTQPVPAAAAGNAINVPDAVVNQLTATPSYTADNVSPPVAIVLSVDWGKPVAPITLLHWGVNDYDISEPERAMNAGFNAFMQKLQPAFIRIHHAGLSDRWTDAATRKWDVAKIKQAFAATADGYGDAQIMINIPKWPQWFHDGPTLPGDKEAEFTAFCGELARIMKEEVGRKVQWWEVLNELDNSYEKENRLGDLWRLQNRIKLAIRQADPQAKVGGPAMTWPKPSWVESYLKASVSQIDFMTWHNYASGNASDPNAQVLAKPDTMRDHAQTVLDGLARHAPQRKVETYLTEFNVSWSWQTRDPRMVNHLGAVFDALVVKRLAELGVSGIAKWHVKDGIYGMLGPENQLRPAGVLYLWSRPLLTGTMVTSQSDFADHVEALAVQRDDGSRSLLLMNKTPRRATLVAGDAVELLGVSGDTNISGRIIDESTITTGKAVVISPNPPTGLLTLPGYSVTLLTTAPAATVEAIFFTANP